MNNKNNNMSNSKHKTEAIKNISELFKDDIVSLQYGHNRLTARVLGNSGSFIAWYSLKWDRDSVESYSYKKCEHAEMEYVGRYRSFWRRIFSLNFSKVDFI